MSQVRSADAVPNRESDIDLAVASGPVADHTPGHRGAATWAALWVLPYLVLGVVWVFTNPPGAAPDEYEHLVKSIAAGRLDNGVPFTGTYGDGPIELRNASVARTVLIPANVAPDGFSCTAFQPTQTAACLPAPTGAGGELVERVTAVGAYPIFGYVPMGLATRFADAPVQAYQLARLVSLLMSMALLFLSVWHLTRWLGRGAAVGLAVGITPLAVFATASVSTSGVEIMAAAAVCAVVVVSTRRPATLAEPATLAVLAVSASALILSRQLGGVTLALLAAIALLRGGGPVVWRQLRRGSVPMIATFVAVGLSAIAIVVWEMRYDHPALTGPPFSAGAFGAFVDQSFSYVEKGVGNFGWLDTPLPGPAIAIWVFLLLSIVGSVVLTGRRADRWTLIGAFVVTIVVAYVTHATVFYPIGAGLQGRHLLPIFMILPMLAGVAIAEFLQDSAVPTAARRLAVLVAVIMSGLQFFSLLVNARRYAVGADGPIWFLPTAQWSPRFGWWPWFVLAAIVSTWLAIMLIRGARTPVAVPRAPGAINVER